MYNIKQAEAFLIFLKISGLLILLAGIIIGLANMKGWLQDKEKEEVLDWVMHSEKGLPIQHPGAKKFMEHFPPPKDSRPDEITHLLKSKIKYESGGVLNASINYMHRDGSLTAHVATLEDVKKWAL